MLDAPVSATPLHDRFGRDRQRTPMQWDASATGGFTAGEPWLPLVDPARRNVADQSGDPASLLNHYRRLLQLRRSSAALRRGALSLVPDLAPEILAWTREASGKRILMVANMGNEAAAVELSRIGSDASVLAGTGERHGSVALGSLQLDPLEGLLLRL